MPGNRIKNNYCGLTRVFKKNNNEQVPTCIFHNKCSSESIDYYLLLDVIFSIVFAYETWNVACTYLQYVEYV